MVTAGELPGDGFCAFCADTIPITPANARTSCFTLVLTCFRPILFVEIRSLEDLRDAAAAADTAGKINQKKGIA